MFGDRLKLARKKAGYSLRGLAEAIDKEVSAQAVGKYERGEMMPISGVLLRLASILDVSIEYLLSNQVEKLESVEFRKLSGTSAKDRAKVEATVIDHLQRYFAVEEILDMESEPWNDIQCSDHYLEMESESELLSLNLRNEWNLGLDPISSMTALLEDQGFKILVIPLPTRFPA